MKSPRLPYIVLWCFVALLLAVMMGRAHWYREDTRQHAREQALAISRLAAENAFAELRAIELAMLSAADIPDRAEWQHPLSPPRKAQIEAQLADRMRRANPIRALALFDEADRPLAGSGDATLLATLEQGGMFRERAVGTADLQFSDAARETGSQRWLVFIARAITNEKGEHRGVAMAAVALSEHFVQFYTSLGLPGQTAYSLWRRDSGRLVVRHPMLESEIGQVNRSRVTNAFAADPAQTDRVDEIVSPLDRRQRMVAVRKLPRYPFYMVVALDEEDYMRAWRDSRKGWALQFAFVFLVGVAGHGMLRRLARDNQGLRLGAAVFRQTGEAIVVTRPDGEIADVNAAFCDMTGYPREELLGRNPRILQSGRQGREFYETMWRTLAEEGVWTGELWNRRRDGTLYIQLETISALKDSAGRVTHYIGSSIDITRRKEDEVALMRHRDQLEDLVQAQVADLRAAKERAESANRAKSEFVANMSHELRTPLHAILGFTELAKTMMESNARRSGEYLDMIMKSGERLLHLLNDLLDLSKLEAGRMSVDFVPLELRQTCENVLLELRPLADKRQIVLRLNAAGDTALDGDPLRLAQVVHNLVGNAIRFSPPGGVVDLALATASLPAGRRRGDHIDVPALRLTVADRGPGVPVAEVEAIFEKFVQSSRTRDGSGGTGLGLSICREIVDLHHGRIGVRNREEGGSEFEVVLPVRQAAVPPAPTSTA